MTTENITLEELAVRLSEKLEADTPDAAVEEGRDALREAGLADPETLDLAWQTRPGTHPIPYVLIGLELGRREAFVASVERDIEGLT